MLRTVDAPRGYSIRMIRDAIGLDIGGANIKAATASGRAVTRPFELWKHPARLAEELASVVADFPRDVPVAVTMTGELCDCFETKRDGVRHILAAVGEVFPPKRVAVWSTDGGFLSVAMANEATLQVAAANWHALASFACRFTGNASALLIDIGSTTTDIIPLVDGRPAPEERTDMGRIRSGELVYTGARRTPVCAVLGSGIAAELFATMRDAYLMLGYTPEDPDDCNTADGRPATRIFAHARLARMLGGDAELITTRETLGLAMRASIAQFELIIQGMNKVAARLPAPPDPIVLCGSGELYSRVMCKDVFSNAATVSLTTRLGSEIASAACAYALAVLATEMLP
jgi:(4-(4-[2-(gamma-L-glutamylamino)ethyl]phenoxymethyl)furan-2-yl)methanamine synthase